ncbi:MAG: aminotransferase class I/II-fold pyridoxal phosphate-dependent enzyme [Clostridiales bacterium]|nr:aminotransferase class I/II-fold pyridoxal phosphate-dependent enzyme [Clostridiales bacterium]
MQAIILAAGMGKRLKELTKDNTKCMIRVNGVTLIERLLGQLEKYKLNKIVIVVGYEGRKLIEFIQSLNIKTEIEFIDNPIYDKTNNIYSLSLAKKNLCEDDTLLFESDLIVEDAVIQTLVDDPRETLALVDKYESWMDGTCVKLSDDDDITEFVPGKKFKYAELKEYYKTVNIYKFSKHFSQTHYVPFLEAYCQAMGRNEYYEQVLKIITILDNPEIKAKRLNGERWYEIDDIQDLDIAESIFTEGQQKVKAMQGRYGGYWRYPKLIDFCYLVNPFFPPQRLMDEIKASFETLLTQYPSGMRVNSLLAAKDFGIHQENIVLGNGAAELIKSVMSTFDGKLGVIRPTFEEYPNRYAGQQVVFTADNADFAYNAEDVIKFFDDKDIGALILINPDNPTGNFIAKNGLIKLKDWAAKKNVKLIVDESFLDFAEGEDNSLLEQSFLEENKHVIIVKSISKSYGVPGLRLGILACGDTHLIDFIKRDVGIWNINSFAEFYMQIAEKYKKDYAEALVLFKAERKRFKACLDAVPNLRVINSQANYFMIELENGVTAKALTDTLLSRYNLFIKDLTEKVKGQKQYIRVAIRDKADNDKLIAALEQCLLKAN